MDINSLNKNDIIQSKAYTVKSMDKIAAMGNNSTLTETNKKVLEKNELNSAVNKANKVLFKNNTHLQFRVHEKTNEVMVKIVDDVSGEVLKEIPPEKMLDLVAKLWEIAGIIVDEKA